jgi:hypothetical protein
VEIQQNHHAELSERNHWIPSNVHSGLSIGILDFRFK